MIVGTMISAGEASQDCQDVLGPGSRFVANLLLLE